MDKGKKIREITIYYKFFLILNHVPDGNRYFPITTPFILSLSLFLVSPIFFPISTNTLNYYYIYRDFNYQKNYVFFIILQPSFPPFFTAFIRRLCRRFNINVMFD